MATLEKEIEDFTRFAKNHSSEDVTLDELYDRWREQVYRDVDTLAVEASLRDMEAGEVGKPFDEFAEEFCKRNGIDEKQ
jgi:hypothetical protein